jgi:peptide/nickel transport system permease protein
VGQFVLRRLFWLVPTVIAITLITFLVMHATPGSPLQPDAPNANPLPPAAQENLMRQYGLDRPLHEQYVIFLWKALRLDFGNSYVYRTREVTEILGRTFPVSLHLGLMAMGFAIVIGVPLGIMAAVKRNGPVDYAASVVAVLGVSFPNFVIGIVLIVTVVLLFPQVFGFHIIPRTGGWESPIDWVLPTIALGLQPLGILARYTRSSMVEVLNQDFIRTAQAKGLSHSKVIVRHALKNGLIPPLTIAGPMLAAVATGSFFVEAIFRVPGMGRFFVESMISRDYPMIMAVILLYGVFLALMNIVVDILYGVIDPRIRLS